MSSLEKSNQKTVPTLMELTEVSNYKNSLVVKHYSGMTIHRALNSTSPSVGILSKKNEEKVKKCITNLFIGTSHYFDKPLQLNQANIIAIEILANYEYRSLKLEDILAICIQLKEGDVFKLTPARILREISKYSNERQKLAIRRSQDQAYENMANLGNSELANRLEAHFKTLPRTDKISNNHDSIRKKYQ